MNQDNSKKRRINIDHAKKMLEKHLDAQILPRARKNLFADLPGRLRQWDRKTQVIIGGAVLLGLLGLWIGNSFFSPRMGGRPFGLCRVFLELNVQFPDTLQIGAVEVFSDSTRIWFTQIDGFGSYRNEPIQCYFHKDEKRGWVMDRAAISRRDVGPEKVAAFNRSLIAFKDYPPDLTMPNEIPNNLQDIKPQTDLFRQQLF